MLQEPRNVTLYTGTIFFVALVGLLFFAWRGRTVDCVRNSVRFDVLVSGPPQLGAELVVTVIPADRYAPSPTRLSLGADKSKREVLFNPYSREKLNCSRTLEAVEIALEKNSSTLAKTTLTYPKDFYRDGQGNYIARMPIVLAP